MTARLLVAERLVDLADAIAAKLFDDPTGTERAKHVGIRQCLRRTSSRRPRSYVTELRHTGDDAAQLCDVAS